MPANLTAFLAQAYRYKEIGDYGVGPAAVIALSDAQDAIAQSTAFVHHIEHRLDETDDEPSQPIP